MALPYTLFGRLARGFVASPRLCDVARPHRLGADEDTSGNGVAWRGSGVPPPRYTPAYGRGRSLPAPFWPAGKRLSRPHGAPARGDACRGPSARRLPRWRAVGPPAPTMVACPLPRSGASRVFAPPALATPAPDRRSRYHSSSGAAAWSAHGA